jgi:hypothetical protein
MARRPGASIGCALVTVVVVLSGCGATTPASRILPPPPGEDVRSSLTAVGLASGRFPPTFEIVDGPAKGAREGAARGALLGAAYTIGGSVFGGPIGLVAGLFLAPAGAVGGGIVGGVTAEPAAKVEERINAVGRNLTARKIQDDLVARVAALGRQQTFGRFTLLDGPGPLIAGDLADYSALAREDVRTLLEITVTEVSLRGRTTEIDPSLSLAMTVNTRLVRKDDDVEVYRNSLRYSGGRGWTLAEWLDDPALLQAEVDRATLLVAEKIVEEVFLLVPFPRPDRP